MQRRSYNRESLAEEEEEIVLPHLLSSSIQAK